MEPLELGTVILGVPLAVAGLLVAWSIGLPWIVWCPLMALGMVGGLVLTLVIGAVFELCDSRGQSGDLDDQGQAVESA